MLQLARSAPFLNPHVHVRNKRIAPLMTSSDKPDSPTNASLVFTSIEAAKVTAKEDVDSIEHQYVLLTDKISRFLRCLGKTFVSSR
ncbi:hypothetical protein O9992_29785 [Vibrio lentus]|nr:hypothetical protein [Vibrio lentus]